MDLLGKCTSCWKWTSARVIYEKKSVIFHVSLNWHPYTSMSSLENGSECKYSVTENMSPSGTLINWQGQNPLFSKKEPSNRPLEDLTTGLMLDHKGDPTSHPYSCGYYKHPGSGPSYNTIIQCPKRERAWVNQPVDNPPALYW